ncbi:hypothetical protein SLS56_011990 [Neofusicoccum ribis]|uniref:Mannosylglycerate hydrolase MGH1-like glycoside hydrolase domain-containing protein n=1 Tax=Neofusicoccum ribis TaxID=45134 RepID=A0ABR3SA26_9PEZI
MEDLRDYPGYFNSDNEKLIRVYADPIYGNALGVPGTDWYFNTTIATIFVSTNSLDGIKNGIESLFILQQADGRLQWAGAPFIRPDQFSFSFTYHLYTLLDLFNHFLYTGDIEHLENYWSQYKLAMNWSLITIDASGMANVTSSNDWLRSGMGGHNVEANSIFYRTLDTGLKLAVEVGDDSVVDTWTNAMTKIKESVNTHLWDPVQNLFFDNDGNQTANALQPQDGNAWAVVSGLVSGDRAAAISTSLASRWIRPYGAPAPEAGATISPFASGFEAPYDNDARLSHAHGWSTGPTSALTFLGTGVQLAGARGRAWCVRPRPGSLGRVEAGFETALGRFAAEWVAADGYVVSGRFETPAGTLGTLVLYTNVSDVAVTGPRGLVQPSGTDNGSVVFENLPGGTYVVGSG